jgi:hypothetical protein
MWMIDSRDCRLTVAVTAAGSVDDPISVRLPCRRLTPYHHPEKSGASRLNSSQFMKTGTIAGTLHFLNAYCADASTAIFQNRVTG